MSFCNRAWGLLLVYRNQITSKSSFVRSSFQAKHLIEEKKKRDTFSKYLIAIEVCHNMKR